MSGIIENVHFPNPQIAVVIFLLEDHTIGGRSIRGIRKWMKLNV